MRTKILLLVIGIVLIATFGILNVDEFTRVSTLNLGFTTMQLPLGMAMTILVIAILLIFLATTLYMHSTNLIETRKYAKELTVQRELADKAESSRFTDLRRYMESQADLALNQANGTVAAMDRRIMQTEQLLLQRFDQSDNSNAAYWGQQDDAMARNQLLNAR